MKVILDTKPKTVDLHLVEYGSCVRPFSLDATNEVYVRINDTIDCPYEFVRLNDGELFRIEYLKGLQWLLADTEVVVSG